MRELPDEKRRIGASFFRPASGSTPLGGGMKIDLGAAARRDTKPAPAESAPEESTGIFDHAMRACTGTPIAKGRPKAAPTTDEDAERDKTNRRPTKKRSELPEAVAKAIGDHLPRAESAGFTDLFKGRRIVDRRDDADTFAVMADDGLVVAVSKHAPPGVGFDGLRVLMASGAN